MDINDVRAINREENRKSQYSVSDVPYHTHNNIDSPKIPFVNIANIPHCFSIVATTTGTTAVNVFGTNRASFNFTITGVFVNALDTTAGNITLKNNGTTVCVVAKGTVAGVLTGATSLSNATYKQGNAFTVVSSSVGNATIFVSFNV